MEFNLEYDLKELKEELKDVFDCDGHRYTGTRISHRQTEKMLKLINELESALTKAELDLQQSYKDRF